MSYNFCNNMPLNNCNVGTQQYGHPSQNFIQHPTESMQYIFNQQNSIAREHVYPNSELSNLSIPQNSYTSHDYQSTYNQHHQQLQGFPVHEATQRKTNISYSGGEQNYDKSVACVNYVPKTRHGESIDFQNIITENRTPRENNFNKVAKSSTLDANAKEFFPGVSSSRIPKNEKPGKPPFKSTFQQPNIDRQTPKEQNYPPKNEKHSNLKNENSQHGLIKNVDNLKSPSLVSSVKSIVDAKFESNSSNEAVKTNIPPSEDLISEKEKTPLCEDSKINSQSENFDYIDIMTKDELFEFVKTLNQETRDFWGPIEILKPLENKVKKVIETIKTKFENENLIKDLESSLTLLENRAPMIESVERFDDSSEGEENSYKSTKSYKNVAEISMKALSLFRKLRLQKPTEKPEIGILKKQFIKCQTDLDSLKNDDDQLKDILQGIHILCNEALDELK